MSDHYNRVIIHADLDAFYAQVEAKRLNLDSTVPLGVQQHNMLIAVSYSARPFGVKRGDSSEIAKQKCPNIVFAKVEELNNKPNLNRYREASVQIMKILNSFENVVCERASVDEAYLDVTQWAIELEKKEIKNFNSLPTESIDFPHSFVVSGSDSNSLSTFPLADDDSFSENFDEDDENENETNNNNDNNDSTIDNNLIANIKHIDGDDEIADNSDELNACVRRLRCGALISKKIRDVVFKQLGFTVSCGISYNKILAKIGSAKHKPNAQTVILPSSVVWLLRQLPLRKLPGLGGKFGRRVVSVLKLTDEANASELRVHSKTVLQQLFGQESGEWLARIARGIDDRAVKPRALVKSITAHKQFSRCSLNLAKPVLSDLANELADRVATDRLDNDRIPRTLSVYYTDQSGHHSKVCDPPRNFEFATLDQTLWLTLSSAPIVGLLASVGVAANNFESLAGMKSIKSFFNKSSSDNNNNNNSNNSIKEISTTTSTTQSSTIQSSTTQSTTNVSSSSSSTTSTIKNNLISFVSNQSTIRSKRSLEDFFFCDQCGNRVLNSDKATHADFHVAQQIQNAWQINSHNNNNNNNNNNKNNNTKKKQQNNNKRKSKTQNTTTTNQNLSSFFKIKKNKR